MASLRDSVYNSRPQRSWNPLERSNDAEYRYHSASDTAWSAYTPYTPYTPGDIGLGISTAGDEAIPVTDSRDSINSPSRSRNAYKTSPSPPDVRCPNRATVLQKRLSWIPLTVLILAVYATLFSGVYLVVAFWKPRWIHVSSDGPVLPSTARFLSSFFAKTIELSYVTVCVAFLGQVLSRRALMKNSRGISISDMNMRAWIMQPGSMIVHWEALRYSALTFLGSIALIATFVAMLYTTAAQALVHPGLFMGPVEPKILEGKVTASFANSIYLGNFCETPITLEMDESDRGSTCLQINHVGHAYHNYQQWMTEWGKRVRTNNRTSTDLTKRPGPSGSIWDNTTIAGSWIEIQDMATTSKKHNRMINNITMAMPHGGIPAAAMNTKNKIKQPTDTSGEGHYNIEASVPSPVVNVLCAGMTEEELSPVVYSSWPGGHKFNATTWNSKTPLDATTTNHTVVDDIFDFDAPDQAVPIFGKYPSPYNTIINKRTTWPNHAIYLLAASPPNTSPPYVLCALRGKQTGRCSTKYSADVSGARLSTSCEQPSNTFQYDRRHPDFEEQTWSGDWKVLAEEWANSLSLNAGITDGAASNARLLTQMMPHHGASGFELDPALPSIAEALAVMAGSTLILSTQDAPFVPFWNYSDKRGNPLSEPAYERFDASIQAVGYASGGAMDWQAVFYVVLVFAFLTSAVCLGFMIVEARGRQVTDFTEPQNLFALAVNSPQTEQLRGACGCGPWGEQLKERWFIGMEEEDEHYYIRSKTEENTPLLRSGRLEQMEVEDGEGRVSSPMVDEFRKVSKRHSLLAKLY